MPKATPKSRQGSSLHSVQPMAGRRTPWRLARSGVIVLGVGALAALAAILLTSTPGKEAFAVPPT